MMRRLAAAATLAFTATCAQADSATTQQIQTGEAGTASQAALIEQAMSEKAKPFGLSVEEWKQYEAIMEGPRGYWSPGLDPLTTLGIEAKTEAERTRYAELQVQQEFARAEAELDYQRAYDAAFQRLYPNVLPIGDTAPAQGDFLQHVTKRATLNNAPPAVFVSTQCAECNRLVKEMQDKNARFDIYIIDSNGNDEAVRGWAAMAKIDPAKVRDRRITLNHNTSELEQITGKTSAKRADLPMVFERSGQSWKQVK